MPGKPQTFTKGQREELTSMLRQQILRGTILALALLTGITGFSLWGIKKNVERRMEALVAAQFDEPKIQQVVQSVAADQAKALLTQQVEPQVAQFKADVSKRLSEIQTIVSETAELKKTSDDSAAKIASLLQAAQASQQKAEEITS